MGGHLLIAEQDAAAGQALADRCRALGYEAATVSTRPALLAQLSETAPFALFANPALLEGDGPLPPGADGTHPPLVVLAPEAADVARRTEAIDLLRPPVSSLDLELCLHRLGRMHQLRGERDELRRPRHGAAREALQGPSTAASRLRERIRRVAGTPRSTVLVTGEPGTGKELVARAVHDRSADAAGPFRTLDGDRIETTSFRDLLCRGGADALLVQAAGGSFFLREVSALPHEAQSVLATLLRDRVFAPEEGGPAQPLDARIVASTARDLEARTAEGHFLGDLFYRLNVLTIPVPPLRERLEDLPHLVQDALHPLPGGRTLSPAALERLGGHDWPGNLRELRATLVRAAFRAPGGEVQPEHLALEAPGPGGGGSGEVFPGGDRSLRAMEEVLIRRVLAEEGGNRSAAARVLGINRTTLYHKLRTYDI